MLTLLVMIMMLLYAIILKLMLQAFETYCTKQAASSMLLATMEREKELLRVFLKVNLTIRILLRPVVDLDVLLCPGVSDGKQDPSKDEPLLLLDGPRPEDHQVPPSPRTASQGSTKYLFSISYLLIMIWKLCLFSSQKCSAHPP